MLEDSQSPDSDSSLAQRSDREMIQKSRTPQEKCCRYCLSTIPQSASVCRECGRHQRWYLNYFRIDHIGLVIALAMMLIAYQQLYEAKQERIAAKDALKKAQQAEDVATTLTKHLGDVRTQVEDQQKSIGRIAEQAKQAYSEIRTAQDLSVQAKNQLQSAQGLVRKAETSVEQLRATVDFNLLLAKAKEDDREAFHRLERMTKEKGPFQETALNAVVQIAFEVNPSVTVRIDPPVHWESFSLDPKSAKMEDLLKIYPSLHPIFKPSFISQIWAQDRFPKEQRMEFLYEVIKSDRSLHALDRACMLMNKEAQINKNILGAREYMKWWEDNRSKYKGAK
jgi:ribosomal protein L40E